MKLQSPNGLSQKERYRLRRRNHRSQSAHFPQNQEYCLTSFRAVFSDSLSFRRLHDTILADVIDKHFFCVERSLTFSTYSILRDIFVLFYFWSGVWKIQQMMHRPKFNFLQTPLFFQQTPTYAAVFHGLADIFRFTSSSWKTFWSKVQLGHLCSIVFLHHSM